MYKKNEFLFRSPRFKAKHRVFFIPYAGAGASVGEPYQSTLHTDIDFIGIQLPGRENRLEEAAYDNIDLLTDSLVKALLPCLDMPFSLWGHCLGAIIMFEVAQKINKRVRIAPENLFVSASAAPRDAGEVLKKSFYTLSDLDLVDAIHDLMKDAYDDDHVKSNLVSILLPGIRADFTIYEKYHLVDDMKLDCNIHSIGAKDDGMVSLSMMKQWASYTTKDFSLNEISDGGHYFINRHVRQISDYIEQVIL